MHRRKLAKALGGVVGASVMLAVPASGAQAYSPTGGILYQLGSDPCLKGRGNCAIYPKSAELPSGRLVASFEKSTVVAETGSADKQTLPVYKSDDHGTTWQPLSEVKAPAYLSSDPQYAKYTSNWTNPYLYVLPQDVGNLKQGTLLLASVVSGDDSYYKEHKAADPNWTPSNDGDRKDLAIALYSSTDDGATWKVVNVVATGGRQGGSAGAVGQNIAAANTNRQVDPIWEPYLMVYKGRLVCYYSDENDYRTLSAVAEGRAEAEEGRADWTEVYPWLARTTGQGCDVVEGYEFCYGPAFALTPDEVRQVAEGLVAEGWAVGATAADWDEESEDDGLEDLGPFLAAAAAEGKAVIGGVN